GLEDGPDRRAAWLSGLDTAIRGLEADLAASEDPPPGAGRPPIAKGSLNSVRKGIEALGSLRRTLERRERAPWSQWAKLAAVTASKAAGGEKGYVYGKDTDAALVGLARQVEAELPANPQLQADVRSMITLVMTTAATSLDAYARYKDELGLMDFIDQEVLALQVLRRSERARAAVRSRFRLLAVDEFQDTSPIQLALFLALGELAEDLIWLGDPTQAIYSFRAACPALPGPGARAGGPGLPPDLPAPPPRAGGAERGARGGARPRRARPPSRPARGLDPAVQRAGLAGQARPRHRRRGARAASGRRRRARGRRRAGALERPGRAGGRGAHRPRRPRLRGGRARARLPGGADPAGRTRGHPRRQRHPGPHRAGGPPARPSRARPLVRR